MTTQKSFNFAYDIEGGYRLHKLELYNWGTFNNNIYRIDLQGKSAVLTGASGSGKTTVLDAITTLMLGRNASQYFNKAAGTDRRERNIMSYTRGQYKNTDEGMEFLRGFDDYTVILLKFFNASYYKTMTLAQVIWTKPDNRNDVGIIYVTSEYDLSIESDFLGCRDIPELQKKLKANPKISVVTQQIADYTRAWHHIFGNEDKSSEHNVKQLLRLLFANVYMKEITNISSFIKDNILQSSSTIHEESDKVINHYREIKQIYDMIVNYDQQVEHLSVIEKLIGPYKKFDDDIKLHEKMVDLLEFYYAEKSISISESELKQLAHEKNTAEEELSKFQHSIKMTINERENLKDILARDDQQMEISRLKKESSRLNEELKKVREEYKKYSSQTNSLGLSDAIQDFVGNRTLLQDMKKQTEEKLNAQNELLAVKRIELDNCRQQIQKLAEEIANLYGNQSNIERTLTEYRNRLASAVGANPAEMPFVAELIRVKETESIWEDAIEKTLSEFGLSILIDEKYYDSAVEWINKNSSGQKIRYYKVCKNSDCTVTKTANSIVGKIEIKPDTPYNKWIERELYNKYGLTCCSSLNDFKKLDASLTKQGHQKFDGSLHLKDDKYDIADKRHYILGWDNKEKQEILKADQAEYKVKETAVVNEITKIKNEIQNIDSHKTNIIKLLNVTDTQWIDVHKVEEENNSVNSQLQMIIDKSMNKDSNRIRQQVELLDKKLKELNEQAESTNKKCWETDNKISIRNEKIKEYNILFSDESERYQNYIELKPEYESFIHKRIGRQHFRILMPEKLDECDSARVRLEKSLRDYIFTHGKERDRYKEKAEEEMRRFLDKYKDRTIHDTLAARIDFADKFIEHRAWIEKKGLPEMKSTYREELYNKPIQDLTVLKAHWEAEKKELVEKPLQIINDSLRMINYDKDRYIKIKASDISKTDENIREFLRLYEQCTKENDDDDDDDVKLNNHTALMEKIVTLLTSSTPEYKKLSDKLLDVRQWYTYKIQVINNDEEVWETYSDSKGKSGGQKEKLASTIMAAGLAHQYHIGSYDGYDSNPNTFRFVMIDEAINRGSEDVAEYVMKLYEKLNLQVLFATPGKHLEIYEKYVGTVIEVFNNPEYNDSRIYQMTWDDYLSDSDELTLPEGEPA